LIASNGVHIKIKSRTKREKVTKTILAFNRNQMEPKKSKNEQKRETPSVFAKSR
jgi:hypothetical protein